MPAPHDFPTGAPLWADVVSSDPGAAVPFYEKLFGWTATHMGPQFGDYVSFSLGDRQLGGLVPRESTATTGDGATGDLWRVYLETSDAETTAQAITGAGGLVLDGPHQVGPLGSMLLAEDSDRAIVGAWQRGENRGFQVVAEAGAPAWFELHTTSYDDAVQFYRQAFGWQTNTMSDSPEFRYTQLMVDSQPYAGIMDASAYWAPGAAAAWMIYFAVRDVDASLALAVDLGGKVVDEPADTPFGRLAAIADPTGALLKLVADMPPQGGQS